MKELWIDVAGGCCRLRFRSGGSTGGSDTDPGVSFLLKSDLPAHPTSDGFYWNGMGVIGRSDAAKLRDLLDDFLNSDLSPVKIAFGDSE